MEQETLSTYVLDRAPSKLRDGSIRKFYYCHRSFSFIKKGNNIRETKSTGSNKIGTVCPSMLEVTAKDRNASVKFWKTHFGHKTGEIGRITIHKETRKKVAGNIYFN